MASYIAHEVLTFVQGLKNKRVNPSGQYPWINKGVVGTKDLVYFSQWVANVSLTSPVDYSIFIIGKKGAPSSFAFVHYELLVKINPLLAASRGPYRVNETDDIIERLALFCKEVKGDFPGRRLLLKDLATIIVSLFAEQVTSNKVVSLGSSRNGCVALVIDYINKNCHKKIVLEDLAMKVHYSQYHFIRLFQKETGKTPFAYLTDIRIERAKLLLTATTKPITDICFQCGFQNPSHFATFFKNNTGISPSEYRKSVPEIDVKN